MPRRKRADAPCAKCEALEATLALLLGALEENRREAKMMQGGWRARVIATCDRHLGPDPEPSPHRPLQ